VAGECYHVFSRSIAKYVIFNNDHDYFRMIEMLNLFRYKDFYYKYPRFKQLVVASQTDILNDLHRSSKMMVEIIAYSLMPTHIHLILKQLEDDGISKYLGRLLNSYTRYFNIDHGRTGPLWEGRFKSVHIKTDEQLLHTTRYAHLNAVSAELVENPEDWHFSSYGEYIGLDNRRICNLDILPDFTPEKYKQFTNDQKSYQRSLQIIKNLLIDS
jgi:putative transposase